MGYNTLMFTRRLLLTWSLLVASCAQTPATKTPLEAAGAAWEREAAARLARRLEGRLTTELRAAGARALPSEASGALYGERARAPALVARLLASPAGRPAAALRGGLDLLLKSAEARALLQTALAASDREHALDPERYHRAGVDWLAYQLVYLDRTDPLKAAIRLTTRQRARIQAAARPLVARHEHGEAARRLLARLITPDGPTPQIAALHRRALEHRRRGLRAAAAMSLLLLDGLIQLAGDLGYGGDEPALQWHRLRRELRAVKDLAGLRALLRRIPPQHPQYRLLLGPLRTYRRIVAAGGWQRVPPRRGLRPGGRGGRGRTVRLLKQRLAAEGYYRGVVDRRYDAALSEAVRAYQRTHQIKVTGRPDRWFWRSLNVPAQRRLQTIELALERWRRSPAGRDEQLYLHVNIPDYHLELIKAGKRLLRQRVVVGKSHPYKCDEETRRKVLAHATPVQSAKIKTLVFSPFWNVTKTIKETELEPERGKDPQFYEKHGYEIMAPGTKGEWVREMPGPANSLGFVKFLFPNPHEVYLHDTPLKGLFNRTLRASSHGCVRVEDAWGLAKALLTLDGQWREDHYRELHRRWRRMDFLPLQTRWDEQVYEELKKRAQRMEEHVKLRRSIPIHVEYITVRVDAGGTPHFLADIYRRDEQRLAPRQVPRCVPESRLARRGFAATIFRVEVFERQVVALAPCALLARTLAKKRRRKLGDNDDDRMLKRLTRLGAYTKRHASLARFIRDKHEALQSAFDAAGQRWRPNLTRRAVRLGRLVNALEEMTRKAEKICTKVAGIITRSAGGAK